MRKGGCRSQQAIDPHVPGGLDLDPAGDAMAHDDPCAARIGRFQHDIARSSDQRDSARVPIERPSAAEPADGRPWLHHDGARLERERAVPGFSGPDGQGDTTRDPQLPVVAEVKIPFESLALRDHARVAHAQIAGLRRHRNGRPHEQREERSERVPRVSWRHRPRH